MHFMLAIARVFVIADDRGGGGQKGNEQGVCEACETLDLGVDCTMWVLGGVFEEQSEFAELTRATEMAVAISRGRVKCDKRKLSGHVTSSADFHSRVFF
jgi:hypothetical protein